MTKLEHEVWLEPSGLTMLCFAGKAGNEARAFSDPGSNLAHTFYASSHFGAMVIYYNNMGWGNYETGFEVTNFHIIHNRVINTIRA